MTSHFTDRPCAGPGLVSYRYKGPYGFVMIGAKDDDDALAEANRSLTGGVASPYQLQVWNGTRYVNCID